MILLVFVMVLHTYSSTQYVREILAGLPIDNARADSLSSQFFIIRTIINGVSWTCVVAFLLWFYRAHQNLTLGGLHGLRYTHGMAVGSFFIPIFNLVLPYRAMIEVYRGSLVLSDDMEIKSWQLLPISPLITWWWILFWVRVPLNLLYNRYIADFNSPHAIVWGFWVFLIINLVVILAALVTIYLITKITQMQTKARSSHFVIKLYPGSV